MRVVGGIGGRDSSDTRRAWRLGAWCVLRVVWGKGGGEDGVACVVLLGERSTGTPRAPQVGYVLGLGDRHLDNLLFHRPTGAITHIDFNIIFEAGARLRVPERVPCRLTTSLVRGLGVTGTEGPFMSVAAGCMATMGGPAREGLRMLLDVVLGDAGLDWCTGQTQGGAGRKVRAGCWLLRRFVVGWL